MFRCRTGVRDGDLFAPPPPMRVKLFVSSSEVRSARWRNLSFGGV